MVEWRASGSSSARLECTVRDREVASSNLAFPTMRISLVDKEILPDERRRALPSSVGGDHCGDHYSVAVSGVRLFLAGVDCSPERVHVPASTSEWGCRPTAGGHLA